MIVRHLNWLFICIVYILVTLHMLLLSNVFNARSLLVIEYFYSMIVLLLFEYSDTSGVDIVAIRSSRSSLDVFLWSFLMNQSKTTNMLNLSTVSELNVAVVLCLRCQIPTCFSLVSPEWRGGPSGQSSGGPAGWNHEKTARAESGRGGPGQNGDHPRCRSGPDSQQQPLRERQLHNF